MMAKNTENCTLIRCWIFSSRNPISHSFQNGNFLQNPVPASAGLYPKCAAMTFSLPFILHLLAYIIYMYFINLYIAFKCIRTFICSSWSDCLCIRGMQGPSLQLPLLLRAAQQKPLILALAIAHDFFCIPLRHRWQS